VWHVRWVLCCVNEWCITASVEFTCDYVGEADIVSAGTTLAFSPSLCAIAHLLRIVFMSLKMSRALGANRSDVSGAAYTKAVFDYVYQNIKITLIVWPAKGWCWRTD